MSELAFSAPGYRLELSPDGLRATLTAADGTFLAALRPLAALDTVAAPDETVEVLPPVVADVPGGRSFTVARRSTIWDEARVVLTCTETAIEVRTSVAGTGALADAHLLAGRSLLRTRGHGFLPSGSGFRTLFTPNPADPRLARPATEPTVVGVSGDGEPGRGHWLFTPSPLYLALSAEADADPYAPGSWLDVGVVAPVGELTFVQLAYDVRDNGFALRLEYEGHPEVDGEFQAPVLLLTPNVPDPFKGLRRHRADLVARGAAPAPAPRERPAWWSDPIFCGWGAQCHLAETGDVPHAPSLATQANYDTFLAELERNGLRPGTVVLDDKWQSAYGTNEPDPAKWPDLKGWIADRHADGRHVLLWWKAWDCEGLPPEQCVRTADGVPLTIDPSSPAARDALAAAVHRMLSPDGLDGDGLKIDFTARTPTGRALLHHGPRWGIALLHEMLAVVYAAAKEAKPDALVMTHTPHPAFVDVTDMIRLNDMIGGADSVVPQMRLRADVTRAACPELPIDTDDWRIPSLAAWREYLEVKPELGIPSLYYVSHVDATGEALEPADYAAVARTWERWKAVRG